MKEDLDLNGNELNYFTTYFNVAYCIMLIPSQVILTYVRPSFWLPGLEVAWGVMTGLMAMTTSAKQVYIIRVFLGLCESSAWPGMITLFSRSSSSKLFTRSYLHSALVYPYGARQAHGVLPFMSGAW